MRMDRHRVITSESLSCSNLKLISGILLSSERSGESLQVSTDCPQVISKHKKGENYFVSARSRLFPSSVPHLLLLSQILLVAASVFRKMVRNPTNISPYLFYDFTFQLRIIAQFYLYDAELIVSIYLLPECQ
jgi:hypothetical protein